MCQISSIVILLICILIPYIHSCRYDKVSEQLRTWTTFKSTRYKSYKYGFPKAVTYTAIVQGNPGTYKGQNVFNYWENRIREMKAAGKSSTQIWSVISAWKVHYIIQEDAVFCKFTHVHIEPDFHTVNWAFVTMENLSIVFIFIWCQLVQGQDVICPSPCFKDPCRDMNHVVTSKCVPRGPHLYADEFMCKCARTYQWDQNELKCRRFDICKSSAANPCVMSNTELCELTDNNYQCQCKEEWMGDKCDKERDPCVENYHKEKPNGIIACGIHGKCQGHKGTNIYLCKCEDGWTDDPKTDYIDCKMKKQACQQLICLNGYCRASAANTVATCVCDKGFSGTDCSRPVPYWNAWGPWQECEPKCGNPRNRKRFRTCSMKSKECEGNPEDFMNCSPKICQIDGEWTEWGKWSECSEKCGGGEKLRTRKCHYNTPYGMEGRGAPCKGAKTDTGDCNKMPCMGALLAAHSLMKHNQGGGWSAWEGWTKCTEACGTGEIKRLRKCSLGFGKCKGSNMELEQCTAKCPPGKYPWDPWSSWSSCAQNEEKCTRERQCPMGIGNCVGKSLDTAECDDNLCNGKDSRTVQSVLEHSGQKHAEAFAEVQGTLGVQNGAYLESLQQFALLDGAVNQYSEPMVQPEEESDNTVVIAIAIFLLMLVITGALCFKFRASIKEYINENPTLSGIMKKFSKPKGKRSNEKISEMDRIQLLGEPDGSCSDNLNEEEDEPEKTDNEMGLEYNVGDIEEILASRQNLHESVHSLLQNSKKKFFSPEDKSNFSKMSLLSQNSETAPRSHIISETNLHRPHSRPSSNAFLVGRPPVPSQPRGVHPRIRGPRVRAAGPRFRGESPQGNPLMPRMIRSNRFGPESDGFFSPPRPQPTRSAMIQSPLATGQSGLAPPLPPVPPPAPPCGVQGMNEPIINLASSCRSINPTNPAPPPSPPLLTNRPQLRSVGPSMPAPQPQPSNAGAGIASQRANIAMLLGARLG